MHFIPTRAPAPLRLAAPLAGRVKAKERKLSIKLALYRFPKIVRFFGTHAPRERGG
jgi:hypothetical protein